MSLAAVVLTLWFAAAQPDGGSRPPLRGGLRPGPHPVGLRVLTRRDASRVEGGRRGRPVVITFWYPAAGGGRGKRMRFADYLRISGEEDLRRGLAGYINAAEGLIPSLFGVENVARWSKSGPGAKTGYETISRLTLRFLDAHLKTRGAPAGVRAEGVPEGFVSVTPHGDPRGTPTAP